MNRQIIKIKETDGTSEASRVGLEQCFRDHHDSLVNFLYFKLGSQQDAHDIAQEAYSRVIDKGDLPQVTNVRAYLFKTANNLAINRLVERSRKRERQNLDPTEIHLASEAPTSEDVIESRQRLDRLKDVVMELSPKCRTAFVLYKFDILDYREIAKKMNLTESMIRKYVLQGLRHCRNRMEELS